MSNIQQAQMAIAAGATVPMPTATRTQKMQAVIAAYEVRGSTPIRLPHGLEILRGDALRRVSTLNSTLGIGVEAIKALGVSAESTVGALMDHTGLNETQVHDVFCDCHSEGQDVDGATIARRLQRAERQITRGQTA